MQLKIFYFFCYDPATNSTVLLLFFWLPQQKYYTKREHNVSANSIEERSPGFDSVNIMQKNYAYCDETGIGVGIKKVYVSYAAGC